MTCLALALMTLTLPLAAHAERSAHAAPRAAEEQPLEVRIASITPSTLSDDDRPLTISGTVTNQSAEQWTAVNLYSFRSEAPIVDATSLAASAAIEADAYVGTRIITPGTEATVDVLDPGESADFSLTVPRSEIAVTEPGVYWLGVHASGDSSVPRDAFADGRARTFIPLVPRERGADRTRVEAAIVVPVRETVWFQPAGRIGRLARWTRTLTDGGRLDSILDAGEVADVPITWLVDPAVPAAVARLAAGNPARSLAPDPDAPPPSEEEPAETPTETDEGLTAEPQPFGAPAELIPPAETEAEAELSEDEQALAGLARAWLDRFVSITAAMCATWRLRLFAKRWTQARLVGGASGATRNSNLGSSSSW